MFTPDIYARPEGEDINLLPKKIYEGPIHIIRSAQQWQKVLPDIESEKVLGFDTETRPSFRKGVHNSPALMQLATENAVYILQLKLFPFGAVNASVLENQSIKKVGVAIQTDMNELASVYPFTPASIIDLGEMSKLNNLPNHGLRTLAASIFGWRITKNEQRSNWSAQQLTNKQITYAATDAWISRMLYLRMLELGLKEFP